MKPVSQNDQVKAELLRLPTVGVRLKESRGKVVIAGLTQGGLAGPGKVDPQYFYPSFCTALNSAGVEVGIATTEDQLRSEITHDRTVIILIYNEERFSDPHPRIDVEQLGATGVWNSTENVDLISNKRKTNIFLRELGIRVPEIQEHLQKDRPIFSNERRKSNATTYVITDGTLDPRRYNTRFIDTRRTFNDKTYHSSVRLMCVGKELVTAFVRLKDATNGSPSVHNKDTPLEPSVITHFQTLLVQDRLAELEGLANRIGGALGPGFYSHDLVTEAATDDIYVCEVGLKLSNGIYRRHLFSLRHELPGMELCFSLDYPKEAARAFVRECTHYGWL
jgi:hypothetical protein